jgi:hypothetical protein
MWSSKGTYYLYRDDHAYYLVRREHMQPVGSIPIDKHVQYAAFRRSIGSNW